MYSGLSLFIDSTLDLNESLLYKLSDQYHLQCAVVEYNKFGGRDECPEHNDTLCAGGHVP